MSVEWCPTGDMTGDFMTKPTQGALFKKQRDQLMGVVPAEDPGPDKTKVDNKALGMDMPGNTVAGSPQECVRVRANRYGSPKRD